MPKIFVTQPMLPDLKELNIELEKIWESKWLTNMGEYHNKLENRLKSTLKVENVSLFNNGTIALLVAIQALELPHGSEVITTPFTFAATPHCIAWNGLQPVFCDIEPDTLCIDADKIEQLITPKTSAIVAVHVYGFPCNVQKIQVLADKYNLKVIYDAAHAFSTEIEGAGIGTFGDITMFSFHATKLFNSIEGGCLTYNDANLFRRIYNLRNFGIQSEELVEEVGINGKMNELQAAVGLLNLDLFRMEQSKRELVKQIYDNRLGKVQGIRIPQMPLGTTDSYQYYPIVIEENYPISRDKLYSKFKSIDIMTRKYFYPICSDYECYRHLPSAQAINLPKANEYKNKVLCLPFYGTLTIETIGDICRFIENGGV